MLNWSRLLMISKSEMTIMFMLCSIIITMMSIFSRENCILSPVKLELNSPREKPKNLSTLTFSPTLIQASQNHSISSFITKSNSKIQVLTLKLSSTSIMSSKTLKKFLFSLHISSIWRKSTQKKPRTSNQTMLRMLISVEVSNHSTIKILTCWEKLSKKLLNKNGLKITSHQTIITLSGNLFIYSRNIGIIFPIQSKYHGENNVIKRVLTSLTGVEKFALLNRRQTSVKSAVKFLTQGIFFILLRF